MKHAAGILFIALLLFGQTAMGIAQDARNESLVLQNESDIPNVLEIVRNQYGAAESDSLSSFITKALQRNLFDKFLSMKSVSELIAIQREASDALVTFEKVQKSLYVDIVDHSFYMRDLQQNKEYDNLITLHITVYNTSADTLVKSSFKVTMHYGVRHQRIIQKKYEVSRTLFPGDTYKGTYYLDIEFAKNTGYDMKAEPVSITFKNGRHFEMEDCPYLAVYGIQ